MNSKQMFFRNLSSAIAKRFNTPFATTTRPKKEVVSEMMSKHFGEENIRIAEKKRIAASASMAGSKSSALSAGKGIKEDSKRIAPKRAMQLEQKISKAIYPQVEAKRKIIIFLSQKIDNLEKMLKTESLPKYDRARLAKIILEKKKELLEMRTTL